VELLRGMGMGMGSTPAAIGSRCKASRQLGGGGPVGKRGSFGGVVLGLAKPNRRPNFRVSFEGWFHGMFAVPGCFLGGQRSSTQRLASRCKAHGGHSPDVRSQHSRKQLRPSHEGINQPTSKSLAILRQKHQARHRRPAPSQSAYCQTIARGIGSR